jgi:hypothetical protein
LTIVQKKLASAWWCELSRLHATATGGDCVLSGPRGNPKVGLFGKLPKNALRFLLAPVRMRALPISRFGDFSSFDHPEVTLLGMESAGLAAVIVGASSGIDEALARELHERGWCLELGR